MTWPPDTSCVFVGPTPTRSYVHENLRIPPSSRCTTSSMFSCCVASVAPRAHRSWNADRGRPSSPTSSAAGLDAASACDVWKGSTRQTRTYYRCAARSIVPGAPALADHPKNVYLPEAALVGPLNEWLARLFDEVNLDAMVASLAASQSIDRGRNAAQQRLHDAEARVRRLQAAIAAGVDPAALVEAINETQAQREAAQVELQHTAAPDAMSSEDIYALIKSLGEIAPLLNHADPALLAELYEALRLEMTYDAEAKTVSVTIRPMRRASERVRGGT
jgi:hypothetical protein